jgi:hypothetical protein
LAGGAELGGELEPDEVGGGLFDPPPPHADASTPIASRIIALRMFELLVVSGTAEA